ncbi:MAG: hypothetical protein ABI838_06965, partial [Chloroflexota bacterium]
MQGFWGLVAAIVLVSGCGGGSPPKAKASPRLVIQSPTYPTAAPTGIPGPASTPREASGGRTAISCRIAVSAFQPGSGGFLSLPGGQF